MTVGRPRGSKTKKSYTFKVKTQSHAKPGQPAQKYSRKIKKTKDNHRGQIMSLLPQDRVVQPPAPIADQGGVYLPPYPEAFTFSPNHNYAPEMLGQGSGQLQSQSSNGPVIWGYDGFEQMQNQSIYTPEIPVYDPRQLQSQSTNEVAVRMITPPDSFLGQQDNSFGTFGAQFYYLPDYVPPLEEIDVS